MCTRHSRTSGSNPAAPLTGGVSDARVGAGLAGFGRRVEKEVSVARTRPAIAHAVGADAAGGRAAGVQPAVGGCGAGTCGNACRPGKGGGARGAGQAGITAPVGVGRAAAGAGVQLAASRALAFADAVGACGRWGAAAGGATSSGDPTSSQPTPEWVQASPTVAGQAAERGMGRCLQLPRACLGMGSLVNRRFDWGVAPAWRRRLQRLAHRCRRWCPQLSPNPGTGSRRHSVGRSLTHISRH